MGKMFEKGFLFLNDKSYVFHGVVVWEGLLNPRVQPIDYSITPKMEEAGGSGRS